MTGYRPSSSPGRPGTGSSRSTCGTASRGSPACPSASAAAIRSATGTLAAPSGVNTSSARASASPYASSTAGGGR